MTEPPLSDPRERYRRTTDVAPDGERPIGWFSRRLWGLHLLVVVAIVFTTFMGLWQMGVYDNRRADERADQRQVPTVPITDVIGPDDPFTGSANYRPVSVVGSYGPADEQVWVSGRTDDGRPGYWLAAPLLVDGVDGTSPQRPPALLVVRGWSPEAGDLPPVTDGEVRVEAVLQAGDARGSGFDEETRTLDGVRIPTLVNLMPYDLYSGYGVVTAQEPPDDVGLVLATVPEPGTADWSTGLRNLAYAIQWWIFGAFFTFLWWRMCRDLIRESRHRPASADPAREPALTAGE